MKLKRESPTPLYLQIKNALVADIDAGQYQPHERLLSERELGEKFKVSRMTVRQALNQMIREGILYTQVGKGTFVSESKIDQQLRQLTGFSQEISVRGARPSSKVLSAQVVPASAQMAAVLNVMPGAEVVVLSRLRLSNELPLCIEVAHIPHYLCPELLKNDFSRESLYRVFESEYRHHLVRAEQTMEASLANARELKLLQMTPPASVLRIERFTYNQQDILLEYVTSAYRGDVYKFRLTLQ